MFRSLLGYSVRDLCQAALCGEEDKIDACLRYFKSKAKLKEALHSLKCLHDMSLAWPEGGDRGIPLFYALGEGMHCHYPAAIKLLEAGTDPCYLVPLWGSAFHLALSQENLGLFRLLLWHTDNYQHVLSLENGLRSRVALWLELWEKKRSGIKAKIDETAKDVKIVSHCLSEAKKGNLAEATALYAKAAEIYLKHGDYELLVEYSAHPELRKYYLRKALEIYQELDKRYHQIAQPALQQKQRHLEVSRKLSEIAALLGRKDLELTHKAYADMLELDIRKEQQGIQGGFISALKPNLTHSSAFKVAEI